MYISSKKSEPSASWCLLGFPDLETQALEIEIL